MDTSAIRHPSVIGQKASQKKLLEFIPKGFQVSWNLEDAEMAATEAATEAATKAA